ncbi:MAG: hypothetical protein BI182_05885 [Acetobacterium sp. MES1]|uniref:vWA domain-containing protein n=1 Tax=Acetobacterium sp. MES1 TaxID=1899015 RepID=UPI000B9D0357|nr:VWA domain-containing protein [Acetobacterium sp. MES1]OXS25260.1 MAG: hypothetical protein BI182_05885 [Acetobacterium sp. MES1]
MEKFKTKWLLRAILGVVFLLLCTSSVNAELKTFLVRSIDGSYYEYNSADLNNSYLSNQLNPGGSGSKMYLHFENQLSSKGKVIGLGDTVKGYMDYPQTAMMLLKYQMWGKSFDINAYFASSEGVKLTEAVTNVKVVDKNGNVGGGGGDDDASFAVKIKTDGFIYDAATNTYLCDSKIDSISGTVASENPMKDLSYKLTDDKGNVLKEGSLSPAKSWTINDVGLFFGKNTLNVTAKDNSSVSVSSEIVINNINMENMESLKLDVNDNDKDGLLNYLENYYGTDINKADTDGDGLNDGFEIVISNTDPLKKDTDGNGVEDGNEDFDADGLNNKSEQDNSGDPYLTDTDMDDLADADEVKYKTKLDNYDTDGDSLKDGEEVTMGLDPLKQKTDGVTLDNERTFEQILSTENIEPVLIADDSPAKPSLSGGATGNLNTGTSISVSNNDVLTENRTIVGEPVEVASASDFGADMKLSFQVPYATPDSGEIMGTINDAGEIVPIDSSYDSASQTISTNISENGTYFVMDGYAFLTGLGIDLDVGSGISSSVSSESTPVVEPKTPEEIEKSQSNDPLVKPQSNKISVNSVTDATQTEITDITEITSKTDSSLSESLSASSTSGKGQAEIVFVLDTTGSMGDEISNVALNLNRFVDILTKDYNINASFSIVNYRDITCDGYDSTHVIKNNVSNWFNNSEITKLKNTISSITVDGGGDESETTIDGLEMARQLDYSSTTKKYMILLTDADFKSENRYGIGSMDEMISKLNADNISTSVITSSYGQETYRKLYEGTGGVYGNIYDDFSSVLEGIAKSIGKEVGTNWITLDGTYETVQLKAPLTAGSTTDSDSDGVPDNKEIANISGIQRDLTPTIRATLTRMNKNWETYLAAGGKTKITTYPYKSNPTNGDTEADGINDNEDTAPKTKGLKDGIVGALKICSYGVGPSSFGALSGHAFLAYTSFVNDTTSLYGIKVDTYDDRAKEGDIRKNRAVWNHISLTSDQVLTIGGWAGWLPDELKGTWINNELMLFEKSGLPSDQRSLTHYVTQDEFDKIASLTKDHCKWTELYNCSAFAEDIWNETFKDNLSAKGYLMFSNPASLSNNIEKRDGYKIADPLHAERPYSSSPGGGGGGGGWNILNSEVN